MTVTVKQPNVVIQRNIVMNADGTYMPQDDADMRTSGTADVDFVKVRVVRDSDSTVLKDWTIIPAADGVWSTILVGVSLDGKNLARIEVEDLYDSGDSDSKNGFYFGVIAMVSGQSNVVNMSLVKEAPKAAIATTFYSDYTQNGARSPVNPPAAVPDADGFRKLADVMDIRLGLPIWILSVAVSGYTLSRLRGTIIGSHGEQYIKDSTAALASLENGVEFVYLPTTVSDARDDFSNEQTFTPISGSEWAVEAFDLVSFYMGLMAKTIGDCIILTAGLGTTSSSYRTGSGTTDAAMVSLRTAPWVFSDVANFIHYETATQNLSNVDGVHWGEAGDAGQYESIATSVSGVSGFYSGDLPLAIKLGAAPVTATISGANVALTFSSETGGLRVATDPDGFLAYSLFGEPLTVGTRTVNGFDIDFTVSGAAFTTGDDILVSYIEDLDTPPTVSLFALNTFTQVLGTDGRLSTEFVPPSAPTDNDLDSNFFRQFAGKKRK